jgi:hypothetical protein
LEGNERLRGWHNDLLSDHEKKHAEGIKTQN